MPYKEKIHSIYKITNIINNKIYIGSAIDTYNRFSKHKSQLNKNKHHNSYLQNSWNKYGEQNFKFEIIEYITDKNKLIEREQYWIDLTKSSNREYGYNINPIANSQLGRKLSEESRKKISDKNKGRIVSEETRQKLSDCHKGEKSYRYGKHLTDEEKENIRQFNLGKHHSKETKEKISKSNIGKKKNFKNGNPNNKKVICLNTNIVYNSIFEASNNTKVNNGHIVSCCKGYRKSAGKHPITGEKLVWMYYEDFVCQNDNGELIYDKTKLMLIPI